jgi:hypothetical protein
MCCNRRARSGRTWTGSIGELAVRLKQNQSCHRKVPNEKRSVIAPAIVPSRSYGFSVATCRTTRLASDAGNGPQQYSRKEPLYSVMTTVYGQITGDGAVALKLAARSEVTARRRGGNWRAIGKRNLKGSILHETWTAASAAENIFLSENQGTNENSCDFAT